MSNLIKWGNGHKLYIKNYKRAELLAYEKAFYFENVTLNGSKIVRSM